MASYTVIHERADAFYDTFERKGELQDQTHYCPGCGHGIVHKLLANGGGYDLVILDTAAEEKP